MPNKPLRHLVLFAFKPQAPVAELVAALYALPAAIEEVLSLEGGEDVSPENLAQGYTHAFLLTFADPAARDRYLVHPAHVQFVQMVQEWAAQVLVFDYFAE
ncbi:Dabb family protein [Chitinimonas arctica]|uniref:Dabb family protein n=1 Tax=Chitinimonas arctica TaxID=2594795 RepID=A0A516SK52_9NEIS|nr:Dabb family protein [Chitinimonas arctica]QDQ28530.1 Dabb family protein [Chitinimonas arctica]